MINKCDKCFYALMDKESEAPCASCRGYSNFVEGSVYATSHSSKPLKEAIDDWFKNVNGVSSEDFWVDINDPDKFEYDSVDNPKHYMLFDADYIISTAYLKEGIEVRDVIEKLVNKIDNSFAPHTPLLPVPLFVSDYVQMMQYLMRFMDKNGVEDLKKARWYLDKLIDSYESDV